MPNNVTRIHTFEIAKDDLTSLIRPFLLQRFPTTSRDVETLSISRIALNIEDQTIITITFEERLKES